MEKTPKDILMKGFKINAKPEDIILGGDTIIEKMIEYAALKSSQDNKALTASFEDGINSLAYAAKKLQEELTAEKLKVINLQSDNKALREVIDFYAESTKDYNALSDMCDKLAEGISECVKFECDGEDLSLSKKLLELIRLINEYNKLKGGKE